MKIKKISPDVMKKFIEANGKECQLSVQKTTIHAVGSSAQLEQRTGASGGSVQVVGGRRQAERRGSAIKETCYWIIQDPPGLGKGYYYVGPVSMEWMTLSGG